MSRFVIVSMPARSGESPDQFAEITRGEVSAATTGCAWLFSATPRVDDPESALRTAVQEYFSSAEGRRVRDSEQLEHLGWCDAIPWIPDDVWERHGLTVFRHPDVERILLDEEEDLAEELSGAGRIGQTPVPTPQHLS